MGDFWYLWLIFALILILAVIVWNKALKASKKRQAIIQKQIKEIENEKFLRSNFKVLSKELISSTEMPLLIDGVCANIQMQLEKQENLNAAFEELPLQEKYAYTLKYLLEDSKDGLSEFFKKNGEPLISLAHEALEEIKSPLASLVRAEYAMFNAEDEKTSFDEEYIKEIDKKFAEEFDANQIYQQIKKYIEINF